MQERVAGEQQDVEFQPIAETAGAIGGLTLGVIAKIRESELTDHPPTRAMPDAPLALEAL